ncbi:hypothetical protein BDK51DRAFT_45349 [Blyttiomyces helicus]|uniref:Ankyrin repeat-containing domain protein n=1 Tax=Blyttiomyces helicus TaxID=388810 RepID=A0A4P9WLQ1_9FUNG|nr:hypothetical protein BDK51DRAFT_45349 [Blyttiomyces helicus]|eukprot:RKO93013.1 hypothetical protein BDK51DRAFT_45349 [Blyttiomyces helicus]
MPDPAIPHLVDDVVDLIVELLPTHVAASLRRTALLRKYVVTGRLRRQIQRALNNLDVEALSFFASVCPQWKSTSERWDCIGSDYDHLVNRKSYNRFMRAVKREEENPGENFVEEELGPGLWRLPPVFAAVARKHWDAISFLVDAGFSADHAVDFACMRGARLKDLRLLFSLGHDGVATSKAMRYAAGDNMPLVRFLSAHGVVADETAIDSAYEKNLSKAITLLLEIDAPVRGLMGERAAREARFDSVWILHEKAPRNVFTKDAMDAAAPCSLEIAAAAGRLDIVQFLHTHRSEGCTAAAMDNAAAAGQLDTVQFLLTHRVEGRTAAAIDNPAAAGRRDIVQFLHNHRAEGCTTAALDVVIKTWAENASFWPPWTWHRPEKEARAAEDFKHVALFLQANRPEGCTTSSMDNAIKTGNIEIVRFLHENYRVGCSPEAIDRACGGWSQAVRAVQEHEAALEAQKRLAAPGARHDPENPFVGWFDVVEFVARHRSEACTTVAMKTACSDGAVDLVRFILANWPESSTPEAVKAAFRQARTEIVRILYEAGTRLTDAETEQIMRLGVRRQEGLDYLGVEGVLREMHGMAERISSNTVDRIRRIPSHDCTRSSRSPELSPDRAQELEANEFEYVPARHPRVSIGSDLLLSSSVLTSTIACHPVPYGGPYRTLPGGRRHRPDCRAAPHAGRCLALSDDPAPKVHPHRQAAAPNAARPQRSRSGGPLVFRQRLPAVEVDLAAMGLHRAPRDLRSCDHEWRQFKLDGGWQEGNAVAEEQEGGVDEDPIEPGWRLPPVIAAIAAELWDAIPFLADAGFCTDRAFLFSLEHDGVATSYAMRRAAENDDLPLVRFLHAQGVAADESAIDSACENDSLEMIACLIEIGAPALHEKAPQNVLTMNAMDGAATCSLAIVPQSPHRGLYAARDGQRCCGWPTRHRAVSSQEPRRGLHYRCAGHRRPLLGQECHSSSLHWSPHTRRQPAISGTSPTSFKRIGRKGAPTAPWTAQSSAATSRSYALSTKTSLRVVGANVSGAVVREAEVKWYKEAVEFLACHRTEACTTAAMGSACRKGCVELVRFFLAHWPESSFADVIRAIIGAHLEIVRILYEAGTRLTDAQAAAVLHIDNRRLTPGLDHSGVKGVLREMHGLI